MRSTAAVTAALLSAVVWFGHMLHYTDVRVYAAFVLLAAPVVWAAWRVGSADGADAGIRAAVAAFAIVVLAALALGALGRLSATGFFVASTVIAGLVAVALRGRRPYAREQRAAAVPPLATGLLGALIAFAVAFGITHAPLTLYDSVSYHLHFAARWLQDRSLSIIATPFSDEAQAYAPANGELFFAWLMAPFHGDLLARIGQLPFALLAGATLYALARRLGAAPAHAIYPALFFLLSRQVLEQAVGANVDLVCAAMFLAAIYFGVIAVERDRAGDWIWFGVAAGLYAGSKYVALVYAPVLAVFVLARRPSNRMLGILPGLLAFAAPWYARNWIVAGSPIYPASLEVAGVTIARGAFTRGAMLKTVFHTSDLRLVPVMAAHAFGPTLFLFWVPFAPIGAWRMASRGWWPHALLLAIPVLMAPLYWFGLPINVDSRFFMPAIAPCLLPLAFVFSTARRWNAAVHALYATGIAWIVIGTSASIPVAAPWYMTGWFALQGLVASPFLLWFCLVVVAIAAVTWMASRRPTVAMSVTAIACAGAAVFLASRVDRACVPFRCDYLNVTSPYIRENYLAGFAWVADNVKGATIAYTGINLPYPLTGEHLANRVVYANIDGHSRWRFHDYDRAYRAGRFEPSDPPLATSSGELAPVAARRGARDDASRPRYERMRGVRDGWINNLERLGVGYVFVAGLSAYEIDYVWHNERGFPIEDDWARADPEHFRLVYSNLQVHVYAVALARGASA